MKRIGAVLGAMMVVAAGAWAQTVPDLMNYQGTLIDSAGDLFATGDYEMEFSIYDLVANGTEIWGPVIFDGQVSPGHRDRVQVIDGNFNVVLGEEDSQGTPRMLSDAFDASSRFLQVTVTNGGTETVLAPRQQLVSAPYALHANDADTLGDQTIKVVNGEVGIGTDFTPGAAVTIGKDNFPRLLIKSLDDGQGGRRAGVEFWGQSSITAFVGLNNPNSDDLLITAVSPTAKLILSTPNSVMQFLTSGSLDWEADKDKTARFGRASIGSTGHVDWAGFAHTDRNNKDDYALLQSTAGFTILNANGGQRISFRLGNDEKMSLAPLGFGASVLTVSDLTFTSFGTLGVVNKGPLSQQGSATFSGATSVSTLDITGNFKIKGRELFLVRQYVVFGQAETFVSRTEWSAHITGFVSTTGDIQENGGVRIMDMRMLASAAVPGTWRVIADFASHAGIHETWTVDVLFIRKIPGLVVDPR